MYPFESSVESRKKDDSGVNLSQSDIINCRREVTSDSIWLVSRGTSSLVLVRHERVTGRKTHASCRVYVILYAQSKREDVVKTYQHPSNNFVKLQIRLLNGHFSFPFKFIMYDFSSLLLLSNLITQLTKVLKN